jgi:D-arabinose 1-dehydrogenase-like Zn-dependent alcohol dehydrogenase
VRALLLEAFGRAPRPADVPEPECPPHGAVVRVEATGLCRSDLHAVLGHDPDVVLPHVPGHEFAGVVARVGAGVRGWAPGARVTAPFVNACGSCAPCLAGRQQVCARQTQPGFTRWGSFAELVVVDHADVNLVALPDGLDAATAAALGCRFATAFRAVVEVGRVTAGEWVAVHGCGGVGLSAVMIARACGARVIAVDVAAAALRRASALGAEAVVDASALASDGPAGSPVSPVFPVAEEVRQAVTTAGGPGGVQLSLDALGSEATCAASIAGLLPGGRHVQVGLLPPALGAPRVPLHLVIGGELEVLGSHGMAARSYPAMLGLVASGRLDPGALVGRRIALEDAGEALLAMATHATTGITVARP